MATNMQSPNGSLNKDQDLQIVTNGKKETLYPELSYAIVGACFDVHNELGRFAREKQYADLLEERFKTARVTYVREFPLGNSGNIIDFLVDEKIILELKMVRHLTREYYRQIQNYLQQARIELGLLVNFSDVALRPRRVLRLHSDTFADSDNSDIRTSPHSDML